MPRGCYSADTPFLLLIYRCIASLAVPCKVYCDLLDIVESEGKVHKTPNLLIVYMQSVMLIIHLLPTSDDVGGKIENT